MDRFKRFKLRGGGEALAELLPNGHVLVTSRASGLRGLWTANGKPLHGDLIRTTIRHEISQHVEEAYS
jgi:hypothetical protein